VKEKELVDFLHNALKKCQEIKEESISKCEFNEASHYRDYGDILKALIGDITCKDKLVLMESRTPFKECKHSKLNQSKSDWELRAEGSLDIRQVLDLEAQNMGYKDYEDLEVSLIREVGECGPECVWWRWRGEIIEEREIRGKPLVECQPDWTPEDYISPSKVKEILKKMKEKRKGDTK